MSSGDSRPDAIAHRVTTGQRLVPFTHANGSSLTASLVSVRYSVELG
jgi:hypothetical protein